MVVSRSATEKLNGESVRLGDASGCDCGEEKKHLEKFVRY